MARFGSAWHKRLEPISEKLITLADELVSKMTDEELEQIAKDCKKPNTNNCLAHVYETKEIIAEAVRNEQAGRYQEAEMEKSDTSSPAA